MLSILTLTEINSRARQLRIGLLRSERLSRFAAVDAARGLAAGVVFFHHLTVFFPIAFERLVGKATYGERAVVWISDRNSAAVMLFFVVSGFCIRASSDRLDFTKHNDRADYARRRLARILPLYWFSLLFSGVILVIEGQKADSSLTLLTLFGNLAFLQTPATARGTWFVPFALNGPLWSLSFEAFFYLIFPFTTLFERRSGVDSLGARLTLAFGLSAVGFVVYNLSPNPLVLFVTYFCVWRIGASAFESLKNSEESRSVLIIAVIIAVSLYVFVILNPSATLKTVTAGTIIGALWLATQSISQARNLTLGAPAASVVSLLARLGSISYALYLLHYPIVRIASEAVGDNVVGLSIAIFAAIVIAAATEAAAMRIKDLVLNGHRHREA
jgi:peptidoglycan/LPS O-acetylase OafA/YrhL